MKQPLRNASQAGGFALVATVSLLVLLTLLALGMLSLSAITLRSGSRDVATTEARANARMALMIAIGELQKQMGPDQRISANANILSLDSSGSEVPIANPHWTGVWDSWIAGPISSAPVNENYPDGSGGSAESHHQTLGEQPPDSMRPAYDEKDEHFRAWLLSLRPDEAGNPDLPMDLVLEAQVMPDKDSTAVRLVGQGSLGESALDTDYVSARLIPCRESNITPVNGRYAWWVGDQSQKASILTDSYEDDDVLTDAERTYRSAAPAAMDTMVLPAFNTITDEEQLDVVSTIKSLDLLRRDPEPGMNQPTLSQLNFHNVSLFNHGVLADVREGGLKRDLNTLLERPIRLDEDGDEFMLYRFDEAGEDRVPLQDLAAYYQLYENDPDRSEGRRGGIEHNAGSAGVMQVNVPDYGNSSDREQFLREYTALYRNPVPVKVQFVLGVGATEITPEERDRANQRGHNLRESDLYKMRLGIKPVVSLWNPNNLPMVMGTDASQRVKVSFPPFVLRWRKYRSDGEVYTNHEYFNLSYGIGLSNNDDGRADIWRPYAMQLQFARDQPIVFEPGEVKMFSIAIPSENKLEEVGSSIVMNAQGVFQAEEFFPDGFYVTSHSAVRRSRGQDVAWLGPDNYRDVCLVFGDGDKIDFEVHPESNTRTSLVVSTANEVRGSGFQFWMGAAALANSQTAHFRNYQFISRFGGTANWAVSPNLDFNRELMLAGFPDGQMIPYEGSTNALSGSEILAATEAGEAKALLNFFMMAGSETHEMSAGGAGAGRRITTRPFLHGSVLSAPQITGNDRTDLYDYAWEWQVNRINTLEEAFHDDGNSRGYYGGGYTVENGVAHVVQQYLPVVPPISIASLSNARLGGFSLANAPVMSSASANVAVGSATVTGDFVRDAPGSNDFRQVTATGQGGLAPHVLQAIGNSYAHPNIASDQAFTIKEQLLNMDTDDPSAPPLRAYADHSYLANKALWDEFFFSSITPQPSGNPLFGSTSNLTATELAEEFLFNEGKLPNRRLVPYRNQLTEADFDELESQYVDYENGFADKIASHLMIEGAFNINSVSVDAWKALFLSLRGKELTYLEDQASSLSTTIPDGTPAGPGQLANGEPINASDLDDDPNNPPEQWTTLRSLSDQEIEQLAAAMVKQVKKRGPFLSLSEFINRRLEDYSAAAPYALKGALQAAIDDDDVAINAAFRSAARTTDNELAGMTAEFPEALAGPVAYGSTPYVDQADVLRHLGSVLTPRGDTFLIRTYGDSLDTAGEVVARVWCEAVVQRVPDYVDPSDEPHRKAAEVSDTNREFGRKFKIVSFRWLHPGEV